MVMIGYKTFRNYEFVFNNLARVITIAALGFGVADSHATGMVVHPKLGAEDRGAGRGASKKKSPDKSCFIFGPPALFRFLGQFIGLFFGALTFSYGFLIFKIVNYPLKPGGVNICR
jgi:hypothetical protein